MIANASRVFVTPSDLLEWYAAFVNPEFMRKTAPHGDQREKI